MEKNSKQFKIYSHAILIIGLILILVGAWMSFKSTAVLHIMPQEKLVYDGFGFLLNSKGSHVWTLNYALFKSLQYLIFFGGAGMVYWFKKLHK